MGGEPISEGHREVSKGEWLFPKIRTSVLSVLSWRQLFFIHEAMFLMQLRKLVLVVLVLSVRERMS